MIRVQSETSPHVRPTWSGQGSARAAEKQENYSQFADFLRVQKAATVGKPPNGGPNQNVCQVRAAGGVRTILCPALSLYFGAGASRLSLMSLMPASVL
jgi:hypothetical protein